MKNIISTIISLAIVLATAQAAYADFTLCNKSPKDAWAIVNYESNSGEKHVTGWHKVKSRHCVTPYNGRANNKTFSYYAYIPGENYSWFGDARGCYSDKKINSSWSSCSVNNGEMQNKFREVKVDNYRHYTHSIYATALGPKLDILPSETARLKRQRDAVRNSNNNDGAGAALALGLGALLLFGLGAEANRKADQDQCMRTCQESRSRCVQLCTQR
jgi:uncharacterized membrane protein